MDTMIASRATDPPPGMKPDLLGDQVTFVVTLRDGDVERVDGADAYQQEQSMTTFFRTNGRQNVDCWSVRMASFRTDHIIAVRRIEMDVATQLA